MSSKTRTISMAVLSAALVLPTLAAAQLVNPAQRAQPSANASRQAPAARFGAQTAARSVKAAQREAQLAQRAAQTAEQRRAAPPPQPTIAPAEPAKSGLWWHSAADQALSQRRAAQPQPLAQRQGPRVAASPAMTSRVNRRKIARRGAASSRTIASEAPTPPARAAGLSVAFSATGAAAISGAEVARALGDDILVIEPDGAARAADLAVAPSLDGTIGPEGERVARLFDAIVVLVARRDAAVTPNELAGKPVEVGAAEEDAAVARKALGMLRIDVEERRSTREEALDAVASGEASGAVLVAVKGDAGLGAAIAARGDLRIISVAPNVEAGRSRRLAATDLPSAPLGADVRGLAAEISLFARRGAAQSDATVAAVQRLYERIPDMLAGGAGPWWRDVPLAADVSEAALWRPAPPDLALADRRALAQGLERAGAERARDVAARPGPRRWVVAP